MRRTCEQVLSTLLLGIAAFASSGCLVVHLAPLYDDRSIEWDETLLGTWENEEDRVTLVVTKGDWRSYAIAWRDAFGEQRLTGHLTRIGQDRFMDVTPAVGVDHGPLLLVAHGSCWVELAGDTLTVATLDYDWLSARPQRRLLPAHAFDERDNLILTSSTAQIRRWLQRNIVRQQLFSPPMTFVRAQG